MKRKKTPQDKKRLSLLKDHPLQAKYPHTFRKNWPRKKRIAKKTYRLKVRQYLGRAGGSHGDGLSDRYETGKHTRKQIRKWRSLPLGEVVEANKKWRIAQYRRKKNCP